MELLFVFAAGLVIIGIFGLFKKSAADAALAPVAKFQSGRYLGGLPDQLIPTPNTTALISADAVSFTNSWGGLLGTVPFARLISVEVEETSQLFQRLTATRIAALGAIALAAPVSRKAEEFILHLVWQDEAGAERSAAFEIGDVAARLRANVARELISRHVRCEQQSAKPDLRACPFCAESVRTEAIRCKHCHADIGPGV
jgi:hypothetical protein